MNEYEFEIVLKVRAEAFDEGDALEMVQDAFGVGDNCGVAVVECEYKPKGK